MSSIKKKVSASIRARNTSRPSWVRGSPDPCVPGAPGPRRCGGIDEVIAPYGIPTKERRHRKVARNRGAVTDDKALIEIRIAPAINSPGAATRPTYT